MVGLNRFLKYGERASEWECTAERSAGDAAMNDDSAEMRPMKAELDSERSGTLSPREFARCAIRMLERLGLGHADALAGSEAIAEALTAGSTSPSSSGSSSRRSSRLVNL